MGVIASLSGSDSLSPSRLSDFCLNGKNSQQLSLGEAWAVGVGGRGEELHHLDKGLGGLLSPRGDRQEGGW